MIAKLYLSGQTRILGSCGQEVPTGAGVAITAHQSLFLLDPTTGKRSLLLLSMNSMSFLKLANAENIHSGVAFRYSRAAIIMSMCNT